MSGVGQLVRAVVAHPSQRPVDDPDDVTQRDGAGIPRQLKPAPPRWLMTSPSSLSSARMFWRNLSGMFWYSPMCFALTVSGPWAASSIAARMA